MPELKIGKVKIGAGDPVVIVCEIGVDHMGDMAKAKRMIDAAKDCGADVAKFQIHLPDVEMAPNHPATRFHGGSLTEVFDESHLTADQHRELKEYCERVGIEYLCTPFCPTSVDLLNDVVGVTGFKTGSGEITNLPEHRKLAKISARTGKPVLVSTGMCTQEEVDETVRVYEEEGALSNLVLMVCTSEYPLERYEDVSLGLIPNWHERYGVLVGYSDHSKDNRIACAAVAMGAKVIEKHFTLAYDEGGCDDPVALTPDMFRELVEGIRRVELAMGSEKVVRPEEQKTRDWAFHSIVTNRPIKRGEKITADNVRPARPGVGIPAKYWDERHSGELFGHIAKRNFSKDYVLQWEDLES
ncbi:MAG: N-acetylneuraminate synthase family protein [bacterium]|nr:N-acetylneuraminate synthase family protein [bacterium]